MEISKSHYSVYDYDIVHEILKSSWFNTHELTQESFKEELKNSEVAAFEKIQPHSYLVDSSNFQFIIETSTQEWISQNIFPVYVKNGLKKMAFLVSSEVIAQISIEQVMDEERSKTFQIKYFDKETEAIDWLKQKN